MTLTASARKIRRTERVQHRRMAHDKIIAEGHRMSIPGYEATNILILLTMKLAWAAPVHG